MNRTQYLQARRLIRDNGRAAIGWLARDVAKAMDVLVYGQATDWLAERADIVAYCRRTGLECNVRHTRPSREYRGGQWMGVV